MFKKYSPFTSEIVDQIPYSDIQSVQKSVVILSKSFLVWRGLNVEQRKVKLFPLIERLQQQKIHFAKMITEEMGKPFLQSLSEVDKCILSLKKMLEFDLSFLLNEKIKSNDGKINFHINHNPVGVVYAIMPWNFPLWQVIRMVIPALISGNVILLKHSEVTPQVAIMIEALFSGLSDSPILLHHFISHNYTEAILSWPEIQAVSLTGSTAAGLKIAELASKYLKKYVLELGGSDPYIVFPDADLEKSARLIVQSRLTNSGQSCIAAKRCLVEQSIQFEFQQLLKKEFSKFKFLSSKVLDNFFNPEIVEDRYRYQIGPLAAPRLKEAYLLQKKQFIKNTHAQLISSTFLDCETNRIDCETNRFESEKGCFVPAEIYSLEKNESWLFDQEFFSPTLIVIPFNSDQKNEVEVLKMANSTMYGLGAAIFTKDIEKAVRMSASINAGQVAINDFVQSDVRLPFGGTKMSGVGRELGQQGFLEFTQTQVIYESMG